MCSEELVKSVVVSLSVPQRLICERKIVALPCHSSVRNAVITVTRILWWCVLERFLFRCLGLKYIFKVCYWKGTPNWKICKTIPPNFQEDFIKIKCALLQATSIKTFSLLAQLVMPWICLGKQNQLLNLALLNQPNCSVPCVVFKLVRW